MTKLIREIRFGPSKTWKTGAVVGSYPKPMLVLELDSGGLDVIQKRGFDYAKYKLIPIDIFYEDINWIQPEELAAECEKSKENLAKVTAIDFAKMRMEQPSELYVPAAAKDGFQKYIKCLSTLYKNCPFATVVVDTATGLSELIHAHLAATNPNKLSDARKWAPDIGYQVIKLFGSMSTFPAHVIMIMHEDDVNEQDEDKGAQVLKEKRPMAASKWARMRLGSMTQQFFYQNRDMGTPFVQTADFGYIKAGLGARWPLGLPTKVGPLYRDIYERK